MDSAYQTVDDFPQPVEFAVGLEWDWVRVEAWAEATDQLGGPPQAAPWVGWGSRRRSMPHYAEAFSVILQSMLRFVSSAAPRGELEAG